MIVKKLKILYLVNIPSPYRVDFFNELGKYCELTVLFEMKVSNGRELEWHKFNFENFKAIFLKGIKLNSDSVLGLEVTNYLNPNIFDIIVIGGYSTPTGMLAIKYLNRKRIPFILSVDGGLVPKHENMLKKNIKKHFISSANYWLSTGKLTNEYLMHYGARSSDIYIYPFTTMFESDLLKKIITKEEKKNYKEKLNIKENTVILAVGSFIYGKGFDVLLNACKQIGSDFGVYFIGGEPTEEYLSLKEKLGLNNVHFIGFKSKEELKEYYLASDLFVLPTREDVWGLVINEAMANGLPVITTNKCVAGVELVKDGWNGFIVDVDDSEMLSKRINEIINDKELMLEMSSNSLKVSSKYTIENMASEHIKIFRDIFKQDKRVNNNNINK